MLIRTKTNNSYAQWIKNEDDRKTKVLLSILNSRKWGKCQSSLNLEQTYKICSDEWMFISDADSSSSIKIILHFEYDNIYCSLYGFDKFELGVMYGRTFLEEFYKIVEPKKISYNIGHIEKLRHLIFDAPNRVKFS